MKYILLLAICCHAMIASAQKKSIHPVHPLTIGDTVPEFTFKQVANYSSTTGKLSAFKGKLVILDMWSTYCTSCIEAFPKMQALQDKFRDRIQVLLADTYPVSIDPDARIKSVLARVKERTGLFLTLPVLLHDTMLNHLFPHQTVPHVVIINQKGVVIAATYSWAVTEERIQSILAGGKIHFPIKNDWGFNRDMPLFVNGNGGDGTDFIYRSVITRYNEQSVSCIGSKVDSDGRISMFYVLNYPLRSLYNIAYPGVFKYTRNRTLIETDDPTRFELNYNPEQDIKNSYCYEVIAPPTAGDTVIKYMQEDLYRNFHAVARDEERTIQCLVLTANGTVPLHGNNDSAAADIEQSSLHKFIHNKPVSGLIDMMNNTLPQPVIDETGLTQNISIDFPFDIYSYSIDRWNDFLKKNGLQLAKAERKLEVAVITDKP